MPQFLCVLEQVLVVEVKGKLSATWTNGGEWEIGQRWRGERKDRNQGEVSTTHHIVYGSVCGTIITEF